jgi:hypothetical protein
MIDGIKGAGGTGGINNPFKTGQKVTKTKETDKDLKSKFEETLKPSKESELKAAEKAALDAEDDKEKRRRIIEERNKNLF